MKTKTIVYTAYAVAAVAAYYYIYKMWMSKKKANKKPDAMMSADGSQRERKKELRKLNRESRRETNRAVRAVFG